MVCNSCGSKMEFGCDSGPGGPYGDETIVSCFYACHKCKYHMESRENVGGGFGAHFDDGPGKFKREPYDDRYWARKHNKTINHLE